MDAVTRKKFNKEFAKARKEGKKTFTFSGNSRTYRTEYAEEKAKRLTGKKKEESKKPVKIPKANKIRARKGRDIDTILKDLSKSAGYNIKTTSGDRTKKENDRVGGAPKSKHLKTGMARDIVLPEGVTMDRFKRLARREGLSILDEYKGTKGTGKHMHVDLRKKPYIKRYKKNLLGKQKVVSTKEDIKLEKDADMELAAMQKREDLGFRSVDYGMQFGPSLTDSENAVVQKSVNEKLPSVDGVMNSLTQNSNKQVMGREVAPKEQPKKQEPIKMDFVEKMKLFAAMRPEKGGMDEQLKDVFKRIRKTEKGN